MGHRLALVICKPSMDLPETKDLLNVTGLGA